VLQGGGTEVQQPAIQRNQSVCYEEVCEGAYMIVLGAAEQRVSICIAGQGDTRMFWVLPPTGTVLQAIGCVDRTRTPAYWHPAPDHLWGLSTHCPLSTAQAVQRSALLRMLGASKLYKCVI
jgi:hypothetical protein